MLFSLLDLENVPKFLDEKTTKKAVGKLQQILTASNQSLIQQVLDSHENEEKINFNSNDNDVLHQVNDNL